MATLYLDDLDEATTMTTTDLLHKRNVAGEDKSISYTNLKSEIITDVDDRVTALEGYQQVIGVLSVADQQTSGTDGGTFTSGAKRTRVLNTELENTISGASLASNQITLPAGTYRITARVPAFRVTGHQGSLYNTTTAAVIKDFSSCWTASAAVVMTDSFLINYKFTLSAESVLEIQHQCLSTYSTLGFGQGVGVGVETFATAYIEELAT